MTTPKLAYLRNVFVWLRRHAATEQDPDLRSALEHARGALETAGKLAALVWKDDEQ